MELLHNYYLIFYLKNEYCTKNILWPSSGIEQREKSTRDVHRLISVVVGLKMPGARKRKSLTGLIVCFFLAP